MSKTETQPRPQPRKSTPVLTLLPHEMIAALDMESERLMETRSVIVRRAIRIFLEDAALVNVRRMQAEADKP
jgi:metal-responsive CopG/Arc/MetJ family transcriptional regulator